MKEAKGRVTSEARTETSGAGPGADLLLVAIAQLAICWWVRSRGFTAISDDDYARVVIAQRFAEAPTLDPSGTSWLPFPFWLQGLAMRLTTASLAVANLVAAVTAAMASVLLYLAARILGAPRSFAVLGAVGVALLPYGAALAAATVPEYFTGALLTFALSTLASSDRARLSLAGAAALFFASASRYEVWPAAAAFALIQLLDARSSVGRPTKISAAAVASAFPLLWIAHGHLNHDNALFFIKRVIDYKEALGAATTSKLSDALAYPKALVLAEPEVMFMALGLASAVALGWLRVDARRQWIRIWIPAVALLLGLIFGAVRGGAPTHHAERALLGIWMLSAISVAALAGHNLTRWKRTLAVLAFYGALGATARVGGSFEREPFSRRKAELQLGKQLAAMPGEDIGLALPDYGYFAVMAAAGAPSRFTVLEKHDPRDPLPQADPISRWIKQGGCAYVTSSSTPRGNDQVIGRPSPPLELRRAFSCSTSGGQDPKNSPEFTANH